MSNEHDTNETTGARLTDDDVRIITGWQANYGEAGIAPTPSDVQVRTIIADDLIHWALPALLADRAALVAEVARLQARVDALASLAGKQIERLEAAETREAAMRPLVEAVVEWLDGDTVNVGWLHATARALVATWAAEPTPAAHPPTEPNVNQLAYRPWVRDVSPEVSHAIYDAAYPDDEDDDDETPAAPTHRMSDEFAASYMRMQSPLRDTDAAPTPDGAIIIPDDPREQARIQREIILDSGVDFAEHYAGLVDDPADDDDAPTPDGQEGGD